MHIFLLYLVTLVTRTLTGSTSICADIDQYNSCGLVVKDNIPQVDFSSPYGYPMELLNYICGTAKDDWKCFLGGLRKCPDSSITFKGDLAMHQLNISIITKLVNTECDSQEGQAFTSGYACMKRAQNTVSFHECATDATVSNPIDFSNNMKISCGFQNSMSNCTITAVEASCPNKAALSFYLKMAYAKGNFEHRCDPQKEEGDDDTRHDDTRHDGLNVAESCWASVSSLLIVVVCTFVFLFV